MGKRIMVYLEEDDVSALNEHTQVSPLSRSELVALAVRRFLRDERRRAVTPMPTTHLARRIAVGDLPSHPVDGRRVAALRAPYSN